MCFAVPRRDIWSVDFPRNRGVLLTRRRLKFAGIFARQGDVHKLHPDRQGSAVPVSLSPKDFFSS